MNTERAALIFEGLRLLQVQWFSSHDKDERDFCAAQMMSLISCLDEDCEENSFISNLREIKAIQEARYDN